MKTSLFLAVLIVLTTSIIAREISQWRGANRDGVYAEKNLLAKWPEGGPQLLWFTEGIGNGYGSVIQNGDLVFVTGKKNQVEYLTAVDHSGQQKWQTAYGTVAENGYPAARCTPTVEGDNVYLISSSGEVVCINAKTGEKRWSVDGYEKFEGDWGPWSTAESPLIVGNKVIYTPGGQKTTMVALDKNSGETVWMTESLKDKSAYVSPILIDYAGKKVVVNVSATYAFGVNADNGEIIWKFDYVSLGGPSHPMAPFINCNTPIYKDGHIFITSGYNHTGAMLKLSPDGTEVSLAWSQPALDTHHGGVVLVDGYLYGSNWINNSKGNWVCIDWETGEVQYEKEWFSKGSIITADGMLYCYEERKGNIALVKATPKDFEIVSTFQINKGGGQHWAHPVINDGILYMRHGDVMMAYKIRA